MLLKNKIQVYREACFASEDQQFNFYDEHLQNIAKGMCVTRFYCDHLIWMTFRLINALSSALHYSVNQLVVLFLPIINFLIGEVFLLFMM